MAPVVLLVSSSGGKAFFVQNKKVTCPSFVIGQTGQDKDSGSHAASSMTKGGEKLSAFSEPPPVQGFSIQGSSAVSDISIKVVIAIIR